ncbi:zf-C3HC4_3 domain-containing protein, partial [Cephalotus follicularis]
LPLNQRHKIKEVLHYFTIANLRPILQLSHFSLKDKVMGISWSNRRRHNYQHPPPPPPPPPPYYYPTTEHPSLPPPPPPPQNYPSYPYPTHPPPHSYYNTAFTTSFSYSNPMMGRYNYHYNYPSYANQPNGWPAVRAPVGSTPPQTQPQPPPYVEHQNAKKVRNDVNVHKDTLRLEVDELNPDHRLVSFVFDALYDGSITICYFAKEEPDCNFLPLFPEAYMPVKFSFQKGVGLKFRQPSGTGIDLGFFELDDLAKPSPGEDVFPLVISAETSWSAPTSDEQFSGSLSNPSANMQITQAVLEKNSDDTFHVKVIRQILWVDKVRYELREIYGIGSSAAEDFDDSDPGKECVICMTEPKDTAILPCRHMCMCGDCAKALRLQSNKCPICRQFIEELIEIKINSGN